ncbi:DUF2339 domain-containing protein [Lysinibacillus sp. SGAir0095]|uniref:DUF2339 domain-containing protein n=1 Tax=Lysinibacillus sp. SGAir0095 TaxID=2070463 RepID=UPI0010CCC759|nr:DUF2339 domain-containing protein [Lysinibacillus sp. SGAir0095]QCR32640.1 hypothetical protein C1N55_10865 [Lysinibacillus sp. SGAir0095]
MEKETDKRIERLEVEVRALRLELDNLKGIKSLEKKEMIQAKDQPSQKPRKEVEAENHLVKLNKAASEKQKKSILNEQNQKTDQQINLPNPQKQRSFEEVILWLLPKVFMVILVLGVLWGLKVISDFGLLSNELKIALAYCLSVGLIIIGLIMDLKKPESSQIFTIVLYGGAFIIGILTTAAGAILYDVLGLYFALLLALIFIAYGIAICYVKKNQVLSIFVIFTSLLLPYLLEYMDFNGMIILLYVVIVYSFMQFIVIKHVQSIAMYISYFFSLIAVQIIWSLNDENAGMYVLGILLLNGILLLVWWHLYKPFSKWRAIHEGLLFSMNGLTILMVNIISDKIALPLLMLIVIYGIFALFANKRSASRVVDLAGTLSLLSIVNFIMVLNTFDDFEIVLLTLSTFLGLMAGLKINAKLMKIIYSFLFTFIVLVHLLVNDIKPFWTIENLNYLLIFFYLIVLFLYMKQRYKVAESEDGKVNVNFSLDIFPIFLVTYFFIYVYKFDISYLSYDNHAYLTALVLAVVMLVSLFVSESIIGRGLRYILIFAFFLTYINLIPTHFVEGIDIWLNLFVRIIYAFIVIAILADIYMKGYLYRTWISKLKLDVDGLLTVGILGALVLLYSLLSQLQFDSIVNYFLVVTGKTLLLFITASLSLWMSTTGVLRKVKSMGYCILAVAIIKLIFSDLDSLNLIVRALLFIVIGGIGLFLSNKLLTNKNKKES